MAGRSLENLRDDLDRRIHVATELAAEQDCAAEDTNGTGGDRRTRAFPTVTDDPRRPATSRRRHRSPAVAMSGNQPPKRKECVPCLTRSVLSRSA